MYVLGYTAVNLHFDISRVWLSEDSIRENAAAKVYFSAEIRSLHLIICPLIFRVFH